MSDDREHGFRDSGGAAFERAARLQEENERLRAELAAAKAPPPPPPKPQASSAMPMVVLGAIAAITLVVGAAIAIGARRAPTPQPIHPTRQASAVRLAHGGYVEAGNVSIPSDFTIEAWVKPASFVGVGTKEQYIVARDREQQVESQCRLGLDHDGHVIFMMSDSQGDDQGLYSIDRGYALRARDPLRLHTWTHVAVTKAGRAFSLYVDGAEVASAMARELFVHDAPDLRLRIGARMGRDGVAPEGTFDGAIDEVRVWRAPRTPIEVRTWKNIPISADRARLALHFPFNEGRGGSARNVAGGASAVFYGDVTWVSPSVREPWMKP